MAGILARDVRVRKESWGCLFYSPSRHKLCFVRSGNWLLPHYFDGTWTPDGMAGDIASRTGTSPEAIERSLHQVIRQLTAHSMIEAGVNQST
jgi:hypothetical protein